MSNKIQDMLRKTEELLKASRNVRANREGLSPETAYGRLKGYHERQGKKYVIGGHQSTTGIPPNLGEEDPEYVGYSQFHPAHEIAHAQGMGFPQEKDPLKPNWKGKTLSDWQDYIDDVDYNDDSYIKLDEAIAAQTSALHSRRAGVGVAEDVHSAPKLTSDSLYGYPAKRQWEIKRKDMANTSSVGGERQLLVQKVAQLRQKLIDLNIFQMKGGQWEKQTGPNARINERQFRQEHPQEAEQLLGKPTIPQLRKK